MKTKQFKDFSFDKIPVRNIQLTCLILVSLLEIIHISFGRSLNYPSGALIRQDMTILAILFFGVSLLEPETRQNRTAVLLGLAFCAWPLLLQVYDFKFAVSQDYIQGRFQDSTFLCEYLLMLPFACILGEEKKASGLKVFGWCAIAACVIQALLGIALAMEILPEDLQASMSWRTNVRLAAGWNPNAQGVFYMIGFGLCTILIFCSQTVWEKVLCGLAQILIFVMLSLTHSQTSILMACCIAAGAVFCQIYHNQGRSLLVGLAGAAVVLILLSLLSGVIYEPYYQNRMETLAERLGQDLSQIDPQETVPAGVSGEAEAPLSKEEEAEKFLREELQRHEYRTSARNLMDMNGRLDIWSSTVRSILGNPRTLILGSRNPEDMISAHLSEYQSEAHNSYLQVLLELGLVGLGFALYFTWLAIKNAILLIFTRKTELYQKAVCILLIALLCVHLMESGLFLTKYSFNLSNMVFMLCLGYTIYWVKHTEPVKSK